MDANTNEHPTETPNAGVSSNANAQQVGQQEDALDKGVGAALKQFGYGDNPTVTEQVSDGVRSAFKSATGKDFPIADK